MYFWRSKKNTAAAAPAATGVVEAADAAASDAVEALDAAAPSAESPGVDEDMSGDEAATLEFATTDELEPFDGWLGQNHVVTAIQSALGTAAPGYNVCVLSASGFGARTAVARLLKERAARMPRPPDWAYVHNFEDPRSPLLLRLPAGRARPLANGMIEALSELCVTVPSALESESFTAGRNQIMQAHRASHDAVLTALSQKAANQNIALLRTPNGYGLAPMHDGKVVKPAVFAQLPHGMRSDIEVRIAALQTELASALEQSPQEARAQHQDLLALRDVYAQQTVDAAFGRLEAGTQDAPEAAAFLMAAKASLVRNCDLFLGTRDSRAGGEPGPAHLAHDARFQPYLVNAFICQPIGAAAGVPVLELSAAMPALGQVATAASAPVDGAHMTLWPGVMHRANGGYILVEAAELEQAPDMAAALKHALLTGEVHAQHPVVAAAPMPVSVKVVLLADEASYERLCDSDPAFASLFKITVRCAERMDRTAEAEASFARWIAGLIARDQRSPLTVDAVAELIGDSARRAGQDDALSLAEDAIADVLSEAHHLALHEDAEVIDAVHIERVFAERAARLMPRPAKGASA